MHNRARRVQESCTGTECCSTAATKSVVYGSSVVSSMLAFKSVVFVPVRFDYARKIVPSAAPAAPPVDSTERGLPPSGSSSSSLDSSPTGAGSTDAPFAAATSLAEETEEVLALDFRCSAGRRKQAWCGTGTKLRRSPSIIVLDSSRRKLGEAFALARPPADVLRSCVRCPNPNHPQRQITPVTVAAGAMSTLAVAGVILTTFVTLLGGAYGSGSGPTKRGAVSQRLVAIPTGRSQTLPSGSTSDC